MGQIAPLAALIESISISSSSAVKSERALSAVAAAVTTAETDLLDAAYGLATTSGLTSRELYELVLQSYLFLGFPRMLTAVERLHPHLAEDPSDHTGDAPTAVEAAAWWESGRQLCAEVYKEKYPALQRLVQHLSPEIFRWMIFEGYGKVLSRPGLAVERRELATVVFLTMENRSAQLFAHARGALNVGLPAAGLRRVCDDFGPIAPAGVASLRSILERLGSV